MSQFNNIFCIRRLAMENRVVVGEAIKIEIKRKRNIKFSILLFRMARPRTTKVTVITTAVLIKTKGVNATLLAKAPPWHWP